MNWTDATTYSRQQPGQPKQEQTAWEINAGSVRIWVSNSHQYFPGEWVYVCRNVGVNDAKALNLKNTFPPELAKKRAILWVRARLEKMLNSLPK